MKRLSVKDLKLEAGDRLHRDQLKTVLGGASCTVTCSNGFVSGSISCEGAYWVCFHSGGPTNSVVSCVC